MKLGAMGDSNLRIYDLDDASEKQTFEMDSMIKEEEQMSMIVFNKLLFIDDDTKIIAATGENVHIIDRQKEVVVQTIHIKAAENFNLPSAYTVI